VSPPVPSHRARIVGKVVVVIGFIVALAIFIALFDEIDQALTIVVGIFLLAVIVGIVGC
jgi:hypothetical protein